MSLSTIWTEFKTWFSTKVVPVAKEAGEAAEEVAEKDLSAIGLAIAQALLTVVEGGTPFATLAATVISVAKTQGVTMLESSAIAALNVGENALMAAGTPSAITTAAMAATDTAAPLAADHPAVVAAVAAATAVPAVGA